MGIVPLPELDIFHRPDVQTSISATLETKHRPLNAVSATNPIIFEIHSQEDEYLLLSECELRLRFAISVESKRKSGTTAVPVDRTDWAAVYPVNNLLGSFLKTLRISMGGNDVTFETQNQGYREYLDVLYAFSEDAKKSNLTYQGWYKDKPDKMDGVTGSAVTERQMWIEPTTKTESAMFEVQGKLHTDLTFQHRALPGGLTFKLELVPNDVKFYMMSEREGSVPRIELKDAIFIAQRRKLTPSCLLGHRAAFDQGQNALYPLTKTDIRTYTIASGLRTHVQDNVVHGVRPQRLMLGFVDNEGYTGSFQRNPFNFHHHHVNEITVYVGGSQIPSITLRPDFDNNLYAEAGRQTYRAFNQDYTDAMAVIPREDFPRGFALYAVNLAPDGGDGYGAAGHISPPQFGPLRIEVGFSKPLERSLTAIVYMEFDALLTINKNREVTYELQSWIPKD